MALEKNQTLSPKEALDHASAFTPGKRLDTMSSGETGDTILSSSAIGTIDDDAMNKAEGWLRHSLETIHPDTSDTEKAYIEIIKRRLAEIALIRAAQGQVTGEVDNSEKIFELQEQLYSHYNPSLFNAALRKKIELLEVLPLAADLEIARSRLLDELDGYVAMTQHEADDIELEQPSEETLAAVGSWLDNQFGDIFDEIDQIDGDELNAQQLVDVLNMAIVTTPVLRENGWHAEVIKREKNAVTVFASDRSIVVAEQRRASKLMAKKLVIHEAFGHALRSGVAETNGNEVGVTGTASYPQFEESFEIALEQCLERRYDPKRGLDHYITIGLVSTIGLSRDRIAQLTKSMRQITLAGDSLTPAKIKKAKDLTAVQIRRSFAGLTDVDDGIAHRQDINYLHGLNGAWRLLNNMVQADQVDEGMRWLLSSKFNPYDQLDRRLVERYTQIPSSIKAVLAVQ